MTIIVGIQTESIDYNKEANELICNLDNVPNCRVGLKINQEKLLDSNTTQINNTINNYIRHSNSISRLEYFRDLLIQIISYLILTKLILFLFIEITLFLKIMKIYIFFKIMKHFDFNKICWKAIVFDKSKKQIFEVNENTTSNKLDVKPYRNKEIIVYFRADYPTKINDPELRKEFQELTFGGYHFGTIEGYNLLINSGTDYEQKINQLNLYTRHTNRAFILKIPNEATNFILNIGNDKVKLNEYISNFNGTFLQYVNMNLFDLK